MKTAAIQSYCPQSIRLRAFFRGGKEVDPDDEVSRRRKRSFRSLNQICAPTRHSRARCFKLAFNPETCSPRLTATECSIV